MLDETIKEIEKASIVIKNGGLVAFPTETVYGLGGDAFDPKAVANIYAAKGRPGDNPLILHIADPKRFNELAFEPPEYAFKLIKKFWPGPLTLITNKKPELPHWLGGHPTGNTKTVGVRMPNHPVALKLIKKSDRFIAAPSANKAGKPSPTSATHVLEDYKNPQEAGIMILDSGHVEVGLESTVVDVTGSNPRILRPGAITQEMIEAATGLHVIDSHLLSSDAPRAPGMKYRHYAPKAPMTLISGAEENFKRFISRVIDEANEKNQRLGLILSVDTNFKHIGLENFKIHTYDESDLKTLAKNLFKYLRDFDKFDADIIYVKAVKEEGLGIAIMDRMKKAAEGRVINV